MPTKLLLHQAFSVLSEAKEEDDRKRQALLSFYAQAQDLLIKMDEPMLTLLQERFKNLKEKMKWHEKQLKQTKYFLLVAGICLKMFFTHKSFLFLAAVAIVKLEIYGSKFIAYLIVIIMLSQFEIIFPK